MTTLPVFARLSVLALFSALVGCGGGGGGGGGGNSFPNYAASPNDSMLKAFVTAAGELKLFDPAAPASPPVTIDTGLALPSYSADSTGNIFTSSGLFHVFGGTFNAAAHGMAGSHHPYLFYIKDGTMYLVDLTPANSQEPVQVSSATDICNFSGLAVDYAEPLDTRVAVRVAGTDTTCFNEDDSGRYFPLTAADTEAGQTTAADFQIAEWVNAVDGSLERLLVRETVAGQPTFLSYAPDLSGSTTLRSNASGGSGPDISRTQQYFRMLNTGAGIARYDLAGDSLTTVHTYAAATGLKFLLADESYLYFNDASALYRVAHDSTSPQLLQAAQAGVSFVDMELTDNRIIVNVLASGQYSIESLPKAGAAARTVLAPAGVTAPVLTATSDAHVYYNRGVGAASTAGRVSETGADSEVLESAAWAGALSYPDLDSLGNINLQHNTRTLVLGEADVAGVVTVRGVHAPTGARGPVLGTIADAIGGTAFGYGSTGMLNAVIDGASTEHTDVYFIDVTSAGSLTAVATTADLDDAAP